MAEHRHAARGTFLLILLAAVACRGTTPEPVARAGEQAAESSPSPAPQAPPATPAAEPPQKAEPLRDDSPVVVNSGGEEDNGKPVSLVEAAQAERERRAHAGRPVAVINDKTLPKYAAKGQITVADPRQRKGAAEAPPDPAASPAKDEQYWRGGVLDIRQRWRRAADDVKELEQRSTELRQKFYLESDTFARDNQIKPEWDRVLDKLRQARLDVEATQKELAQFLEEARAAGVMPGWLREGEEEEPEEPKKKEAAPPLQAIDPPILEPPPHIGDDDVRGLQ
jgi:hypothetical protein